MTKLLENVSENNKRHMFIKFTSSVCVKISAANDVNFKRFQSTFFDGHRHREWQKSLNAAPAAETTKTQKLRLNCPTLLWRFYAHCSNACLLPGNFSSAVWYWKMTSPCETAAGVVTETSKKLFEKVPQALNFCWQKSCSGPALLPGTWLAGKNGLK